MIKIDKENGLIEIEGKTISIGSPEGFNILSDLWIRSGWDNKYVYSFSWLGRPIIQLPDDMIRIQEVIFNIKPDVVIETGIAHGGSLIFYASILKAMEKGRVIGIDIEIRPHNKKAIQDHFLSSYITMIEGSSTSPETLELVKQNIHPGEQTIIILDSNHSYQHVMDELKGYASMVSVGSYIVVTDGIMSRLKGAPRTSEDWTWNNPEKAAIDFVKENSDFILEEPEFPFNEGNIRDRVTYWPNAFVKRIR